MVTLLCGDVFRITHQEMIKGIAIGQTGRKYKYYHTLTVPIIENTPEEKDLTDRMAAAMKKYPVCHSIFACFCCSWSFVHTVVLTCRYAPPCLYPVFSLCVCVCACVCMFASAFLLSCFLEIMCCASTSSWCVCVGQIVASSQMYE
jgi:hypothetical protein